MSDVPARLRELVVRRAANHCEYCGLSQERQEATFHLDHILPRGEGGPTSEDNLALACVSCSLHKADRRTSADPLTGQEVALFHPRLQRWKNHFTWDGALLVGLTPTGRATIEALQMNHPRLAFIRQSEAQAGRYPLPE